MSRLDTARRPADDRFWPDPEDLADATGPSGFGGSRDTPIAFIPLPNLTHSCPPGGDGETRLSAFPFEYWWRRRTHLSGSPALRRPSKKCLASSGRLKGVSRVCVPSIVYLG